MEMNEESLWKQFATTGKVQDYLSYCKEERAGQKCDSAISVDHKCTQRIQDQGTVRRAFQRKSEGSNHERTGNSHGDDINSISD